MMPIMKWAQWMFAEAGTGLGARAEFRLLIAYDDFFNGSRAMKFVERLIDEFGEVFTFVPRLLKFENLTKPEVAQEMEKEAARADMVLVAAYGDADLPLLVKNWLWNLGPSRAESGSSLMALLSPGDGANSDRRPAEWYLCEAAKRSERRFLADSDEFGHSIRNSRTAIRDCRAVVGP